jgi:BON domain
VGQESSKEGAVQARSIPRTLTAAGLGAAATYYLDPDRGRARRTQLRDQAVALARKGRRAVERKLRYERGQLQGVAHRVTHPIPAPPADDRALADRVRSEVLGRLDGDDLTIDVVDRVVTVRGQVADTERAAEIGRRIGKVAGVADVVNLLHPPGTPAPNKQAARSTGSRRASAGD